MYSNNLYPDMSKNRPGPATATGNTIMRTYIIPRAGYGHITAATPNGDIVEYRDNARGKRAVYRIR